MRNAINAADAKKAQLSDQVKNYLIKIEQDADLAEFYQDRMKELAGEVKTLTAQIISMTDELDSLEAAPETLTDDELTAMAEEFAKVENRELLAGKVRSIINTIRINGNGIDLTAMQDRLDRLVTRAEFKVQIDEKIAASEVFGKPYFTVFFKNKDVRRVIPDANNDEKALFDTLFKNIY